MSGLQSALIGAGGKFLTDPRHLNLISVNSTRLNLKTASATLAAANVAGFFTAMALRGATTSIATAGTYVQVCSLTGGGFFFNAVAPTHTAAFTPTIRLTIDGVVYTIAPSAAQATASRLVLGPVTPGVLSAAGDAVGVNDFTDYGFSAGRTGGVAIGDGTSPAAITTPENILSYGMPCLRFESSLIVEMKCDLLSGTAVDKQCGVTYRLDL